MPPFKERGAGCILAHKAVIARFECQRLPEDQTHAQGGWQTGCEVSPNSEQNRGRYEKREVVVVCEMSWWPRS